jgi:hypothetical protein
VVPNEIKRLKYAKHANAKNNTQLNVYFYHLEDQMATLMYYYVTLNG